MPSAKPDNAEIRAVRARRGLYSPPDRNLFAAMFVACRDTLEGGYITVERAQRLLDFLAQNAELARIFPNNLLQRLLALFVVPSDPPLIDEATMLGFIVDEYLEDSMQPKLPSPGIRIGVNAKGVLECAPLTHDDSASSARPPLLSIRLTTKIHLGVEPHFRDAYSLIFDVAPDPLPLTDRFVAFTGAFSSFTRKTCFEAVRKLGGVPSDPDYYLDYLFVSDAHLAQRAISSKLSAAMYYRRLYGHPIVLREADWIAILSK